MRPAQVQQFDYLQLVEQLTGYRQPQVIAETFALQICQNFKLHHVLVYHYQKDHNTLIPIGASNTKILHQLQPSTLNEVDNPLVYTLINNHPCFIESISTLVDVGRGFESIKRHMLFDDALYITPLNTHQQSSYPSALLICYGNKENIEHTRKSTLWLRLTTIFGSILATAFDLEKRGAFKQVNQIYSPSHFQNKRQELSAQFVASEYVGNSKNADAIRNAILKMAPTPLSILLTGETGVGKDYVASLIHKASDRSHGEFIAVNCAAIPSGLIEAELFGNVKGAFTGAFERKGLVALAHKGTLFLDEVGDMPLDMQASLLRLLNEKKYRPIGSNEEKISDFRLICATNKNLHTLIGNGLFREDLYYRIRQDVIEIMPLRKRVPDIKDLCQFFIAQFYLHFNKRILDIAPEALSMLEQHNFPGNLRELKNYLYAACEYTEMNSPITQQTMCNILRQAEPKSALKNSHLHTPLPLDSTPFDQIMTTDNIKQTLENIEQHIITERLTSFSGSRAKAAQSLGIPLRTLARRCQQWEL